jgi:hypothetical protein
VVCPATHLEPGVVEADHAPVTGLLDLGRYPAGTDEVDRAVAEALSASTFRSVPREDVMAWKHAKLLMNLGNAVQAVCGLDPEGDGLARRARQEGRAVLEAAGIPVTPPEVERARRAELGVNRVAGGWARGGSSWQSLRRGAGTIEADYLNGEIVLLGRLLGVATPVNAVLQRLADEAAATGAAPGTWSAAAVRDLVEEGVSVEIVVHTDELGAVTYRDLIAAARLAGPGDSGAVACAGGQGLTPAPPEQCQALATAGRVYDLPLAGDEALVDRFRDEILAQSPLGYLLIIAVYGNPQLVARLDRHVANVWEQDYAQTLYDSYRGLIASVLADPDSTAVVTAEHVDDMGLVLSTLAYGNPWVEIEPVMTVEEADAIWPLWESVLLPMEGMDRREVVAYMNRPAVHDRVRAALEAVPTLDLNRPWVGG